MVFIMISKNLYRTAGYVYEVQFFAKFENKGSTRKNFCWKREILIFSNELNLA